MLDETTKQLLEKVKNIKNKQANEITEKLVKLFEIYKTLYNTSDHDLTYKYGSNDQNKIRIHFYYGEPTSCPRGGGKKYNNIMIFNNNGDSICCVYNFKNNLKEIEFNLVGYYNEHNLIAINKMLENEIDMILNNSKNFLNNFGE